MPKKQKITTILTVIAIILFLAGSYSFLSKKTVNNISSIIGETIETEKENPEKPINNENKNTVTQKTTQAYLEIESVRYTSNIAQNTSVYDFMNKMRVEKKINFKDKTYTGMGKFIYEINDVKNIGSKNWIYYVNGEKAQVGVSDYKINPNDIVSWKFEDNIN